MFGDNATAVKNNQEEYGRECKSYNTMSSNKPKRITNKLQSKYKTKRLELKIKKNCFIGTKEKTWVVKYFYFCCKLQS